MSILRKLIMSAGAAGICASVTLCGSAVMAAQAPSWQAQLPAFATSPMGWHILGGVYKGKDLTPAPGLDGPVGADPEHPNTCNTCGGAPSARIGNYKSPLLQPWAAAAMKKDNDAILAGGAAYDPAARCWPPGPNIITYPVEPVWFLPTPDALVMLYERGQAVRYIYMNQEHSKNLKPTWGGESVGHIEGDTLVIDTIGFNGNDKNWVDLFGTRHTDKLHMVERYRTVNDDKGEKMLELVVKFEDPGAFTKPWGGLKMYGPVDGQYEEAVCAENNEDIFNQGLLPLPTTKTPDF